MQDLRHTTQATRNKRHSMQVLAQADLMPQADILLVLCPRTTNQKKSSKLTMSMVV